MPWPAAETSAGDEFHKSCAFFPRLPRITCIKSPWKPRRIDSRKAPALRQGMGTGTTTCFPPSKNPCGVPCPDAAVHYLARLLEAETSPRSVGVLMVTACEDVRLAYPQIIPIVGEACVDAAFQVGTAGSTSVPRGWSNFSQYRAEIKFRS